jgi:transcriptional regulator
MEFVYHGINSTTVAFRKRAYDCRPTESIRLTHVRLNLYGLQRETVREELRHRVLHALIKVVYAIHGRVMVVRGLT